MRQSDLMVFGFKSLSCTHGNTFPVMNLLYSKTSYQSSFTRNVKFSIFLLSNYGALVIPKMFIEFC